MVNMTGSSIRKQKGVIFLNTVYLSITVSLQTGITYLVCCCQVLESVVKNCGSIVHVDIATREFMDFMKEQAKVVSLY